MVADKLIDSEEMINTFNLESGSFDWFADLGSPWEFNLRDLMRWCDMVVFFVTNKNVDEKKLIIVIFFSFITLFYQRFRNLKDRKFVLLVFIYFFEFLEFHNLTFVFPHYCSLDSGETNFLSIGMNLIRKYSVNNIEITPNISLCFSDPFLFRLSSFVHALNSNILVIISGSAFCGKTFFVKNLFFINKLIYLFL
jgi:midasin (ATPase involved in ribosome maturation)